METVSMERAMAVVLDKSPHFDAIRDDAVMEYYYEEGAE